VTPSLKSLFLLDPEIIYLNHGSFGACPRPVFEKYQEWQRELERQPMAFLSRRVVALMAEAREMLAAYINCSADEVVYFTNPTTALNMVLRNLDLRPGDEVLASDHEYGALDRSWRFICSQKGAHYVRQPVTLPMASPEKFVEQFFQGLTPRTRVVYLSHITSPTGLIFPVEAVCRLARQKGLITIVDGAHAPGQVALDVASIGADFYAGACHKWLCAPKGSAFLYARREVQDQLLPLVVSWGYQADPGFGTGNNYIDYHEWQGTRDLAPFLAVPAAIVFQEQHHWDAVRDRCHHLAQGTRARLNALTDLSPICPDTSMWFAQMFAARLPEETEVEKLKDRLYSSYRIEVPVYRWNDQPLIRVSVQGYNTQGDTDALIEALADLLPETSHSN
jgi:isopenicillin-N epimerase